MEAKTKLQQLTFEKGITNVPSDVICSDNTLEECMGLTYADGEHRVIQKPAEEFHFSAGSGKVLLYVHAYNGVERVILKNGTNVQWAYKSSPDANNNLFSLSASTDEVSVESIGNTLICKTATGIRYFLWSNSTSTSTYKDLGSNIPSGISVKFSLGSFSNEVFGNQKFVDLTEMMDGKVLGYVQPVPQVAIFGSFFKNDKYEDAKNTLIGLVSMRLDEVKENNRFAFPFWARYAVRLYDGTYTHISNPVLLFPTVRNNWNIFTCKDDGSERPMRDGQSTGGWPQTNYKPYHAKLFYDITFPSDISSWSDIIAGVDIFVSEEVKTFDMEGKWTIQNAMELVDENTSTNNPVFNGDTVLVDACKPEFAEESKVPEFDINTAYPSLDVIDQRVRTYFQPAKLSDNDITSSLLERSVFYKIVEHESLTSQYNIDTSTVIKRNVLKTLKTQPQLDHDDYYSHASITGAVMKTYNNRLHLGNITRGFFNGFTHFSYTKYENAYSTNYTFVVYISSNSGLRIVKASASSNEIADAWFYYPDPRARRVEVYTDSQTLIASMSLKEHPSLNGAYAFIHLPAPGMTRTSRTNIQPNEYAESERLADHIFVSETDNPWVFNAKGDVTTKMGAVIGMATQTMSLGEQEHGIHPLTVFSERGISLLRLNEEGVYMRTDEINREVCNNVKSITETDGPVFFSSEKGLMVLAGAQVKCVSEQLSGKSLLPFQKYIKTAFIAYDYRDSLLWIFNGTETSWIYNIKSGTFSQYHFETPISNVVNDYPDYLLQSGTQIYTLLHRVNINDDTTKYSARMVSRPMKLENLLALKSIAQICNIRDAKGGISLTIKGCNELKGGENQWITLNSLRGTPYNYYRFEYNFANMLATDRFSGTMLATKEIRTNKLRWEPVSSDGGSGGGGGGGGGDEVILHEPLASINAAGLDMPAEANVGIVWNGSAWTFASISGGGGGGTDMQTVWQNLAASGNQQINASHLTNALQGYLNYDALRTELANYFSKDDSDRRYLKKEGDTATGLITFNQGIRIGTAANGITIEYDSANNAIKVNGSIYASGGVSALGYSGGGGGGGVTLNDPLSSINSTLSANPTSSQIGYGLVWNGSRWTLAPVGGGGGGATALTGLSDVNPNMQPTAGQVLTYRDGKWTSENPQGGGGGGGTVTSVSMSVPTGFSITGTPITSSGTLALTFANGYSLPTTQKQDNWDTAYGWGNHASAGYLKQSAISDMATKTWVGQQGYLKASDLNGYATQQWVGQQGYATQQWVGQNYLGKNDTAAAAAKLQTARKIWGQSFDGTGNITGNMEDVGIILQNGQYTVMGRNEAHGALIESMTNSVTIGLHNGNGVGWDTRSGSGYMLQLVYDASNTVAKKYARVFDGLRIGDGMLVWDSTNNALKVINANGTAANLYATGGVSALGMSAGVSTVDAMTFGYLTVNNMQYIKANNYTHRLYGNSNGMLVIDGSEGILFNNDIHSNEYDIYTDGGNIRTGGGRIYLDTTRYIYVNGGTLYYFNGSTSRQIAFT